jgi:hypothetical protein
MPLIDCGGILQRNPAAENGFLAYVYLIADCGSILQRNPVAENGFLMQFA